MILSREKELAYLETIKAIPITIRHAILNTSIQLTGQIGEGPFVGSGVILYAAGDTTYILTAKHNLYVSRGLAEPPIDEDEEDYTWDDQWVTDFKDHFTINYGDSMKYGSHPDCTAAISEVIPLHKDESKKTWDYDLMLVKSTDKALNKFANIYYVYDPDTGFSESEKTFLYNPENCLDRNNDELFWIQTGYGDIKEKIDNTSVTLPLNQTDFNQKESQNHDLQFRFTKPEANATIGKVYNKRIADSIIPYDSFTDTIVLTVDNNDSTGPGDSGGPLFVVNTNDKSYYLLGITTGADMLGSENPCPTRTQLQARTYRVNNIVTFLKWAYQNNKI